MPQKRDRSEAFGACRFAEGLILIFFKEVLENGSTQEKNIEGETR